MIKKLTIFILTFLLIISTLSCNAFAYQISGFELDAHTALLISLDTDEVLFSQNADDKVYPASLTKMLTAVILIENTGNLDTEIITYTKEANNA
ncbi:MAG: D-alanyl-D-alanine carboxypeptidase, partial [Clostridia bacterium]|nr:D-alanyl-D-alanine carboxypeptidase [Clostridia bacterium]